MVLKCKIHDYKSQHHVKKANIFVAFGITSTELTIHALELHLITIVVIFVTFFKDVIAEGIEKISE